MFKSFGKTERDRTLEIIRKVGLEGYEKRPIGELSGGQTQRVLLARALAAKPEVLILDEPTKGIDVGSKSEIHRMISDLAGQGIAIILISSECDEAMGIADRILVFHKGTIVNEVLRADFDKNLLIKNAFGIVENRND